MLSPAILARSGALPLVHRTTDIDRDRLRKMYWHLPNLSRAQYLIHIYYRLGAWMHVVIIPVENNTDLLMQVQPHKPGRL